RKENLAQVEQAQKRTEEQLRQKRDEQDSLKEQIEAIRPLAEAKQKGRWWSPTWWKATFRGDVLGKLAALETQEDTVKQALATLKQEMQALAHQGREAESKYQADRGRLLETEVALRQAVLTEQETALRQEQEVISAKWNGFRQELGEVCPCPDTVSVVAVTTATEGWRKLKSQAEEGRVFARQWADYLEVSAKTLPTRLPRCFNVVAAVTTALAADEHFGDAVPNAPPFDLLVLEEAEQITESEFLRLARRARRWVLVGEPEWETSAHA